jgi:hypothetical protein
LIPGPPALITDFGILAQDRTATPSNFVDKNIVEL